MPVQYREEFQNDVEEYTSKLDNLRKALERCRELGEEMEALYLELEECKKAFEL